MSYLGLDIGTTGCKAVVFSAEGQSLGSAYCEYPLLTPLPGYAEVDSARVLHDCCDVIRRAAAVAKHDPVRGLAISSQGEAFTPVSDSGELLGNGMVSSDVRAVDIVESFTRRFGSQWLYDRTGHTPHPMFTLFKILWLRQHRRETFSSARQFLCFEDLFQRYLGIEPAISWSLAGRTMLFNIHQHQWDEEILQAIDLDPAKLAHPAPSGSIVGTIPRKIAHELGLPDGVIVAAGGHDQPCGALGAGVVEPGEAMYASGTVECICPAIERLCLNPAMFEANLCSYDFTIPGMYTTVLFSLTGGNLLRWFRDQWGQLDILEASRSGVDPYDLILQAMPPEPTDLLVLPYFTPSGTPYFDTNTPGAIYGLRLATTRGEVLRALIEGVALEMKLNLNILRKAGLVIDHLRAIGGGAKSTALLQLKADVLDCVITTMAVTEAGCLGTAMLACAAHTGASLHDLSQTWSRPGLVIEPNLLRAARYNERFCAYSNFYQMVRNFNRSCAISKNDAAMQDGLG